MARLLGISSLIVGLVLLLAGGSWFPGATTVGLILVCVSVIVLVFTLLIFLVIGAAIAKVPPTRFKDR